MAQYDVEWSVRLVSTTAALSVGQVLVRNPATGYYYPATSANRAAYGRAAGIARSAGDASNLDLELQLTGLALPSVTLLSTGTATWVRVSATGFLERVTPSGSDDVVGWAETDGTVHLFFGIAPLGGFGSGGGGGGTPGGSNTQAQYNNGGAFGGIVNLTSDGTNVTKCQFSADPTWTKGGFVGTLAWTPTAARALTLPDATDTVVGRATTDTLTNKTIVAASNHITDTSAAVGDVLAVISGTDFTRLAKGSNSTFLGISSGGALGYRQVDISTADVTGTLPISKVGAPTGTGFATVTSSAWDAAATANIRYTGGKLQTDANVQWKNGANLGDLAWTPTTARTLTLPDATDTIVGKATTDTLTNKTINATNNTLTDTSAATGDIFRFNGTRFVRLARGSANQVLAVNGAGTDIAWASISTGAPGGSSTNVQYNNGGAFGGDANFTYDGAGNVAVSSSLSAGATVASAGVVRVPNVGHIKGRNAGNTGDVTIAVVSALDRLYLGMDTGFGTQAGSIWAFASGDVSLGIGSSEYFTCDGSIGANTSAKPLKGDTAASSPYGAHADVVVADPAAGTTTLSASEYSCHLIQVKNIIGTTSGASSGNIDFPTPSANLGYPKFVYNGFNSGNVVLRKAGGGGATVTLGAGQIAIIWVNSSGVYTIK